MSELPQSPLDHVLWAAPDLDSATRLFADVTGVAPMMGGSHAGFGTRNSLAGLGEMLYVEVLAPDPAQSTQNDRARKVAALPGPEVHTFAIRGQNVEAYRDAARALGLTASDPAPMGRLRKDGVQLNWRSSFVTAPGWEDMIPFMIDWMGSEHPSKSTPGGCTILEFSALHPKADDLAGIYKALAIPVPVKGAAEPGFLLRLATPKGEVVLT